jgi:hypothetical protein
MKKSQANCCDSPAGGVIVGKPAQQKISDRWASPKFHGLLRLN